VDLSLFTLLKFRNPLLKCKSLNRSFCEIYSEVTDGAG
jgi:hypothetical protein